MNRRKFKTYHLHRKIALKDAEGVITNNYSNEYELIMAEIWPATGKLQAQMYGLKLAYIMNMNTDKSYSINEGDGISVYGEKPDHKVISKKVYTKHIVYELERIMQ